MFPSLQIRGFIEPPQWSWLRKAVTLKKGYVYRVTVDTVVIDFLMAGACDHREAILFTDLATILNVTDTNGNGMATCTYSAERAINELGYYLFNQKGT